MNKTESAVQVLGQIETLIGASTGKSVVAKIKAQIKTIKDDFNELVNDGDYDYFVDYCNMDRSELLYDGEFDRYEAFRKFQDAQYELYLDEVEDFIREIDGYEMAKSYARNKIRNLQDLLEE